MGQAPASQARPRDTDHLQPSNLAERTLSLVEHTISKFGCNPCPVRRGITAAVKCYVRKARFFWCRQRTEMTHHYRRHCSRVSVRWRENLFCFLISGSIIVGLRTINFGDFLLVGIVRTIDLGYCLLIGIVRTIDLGYCLLIGIVRTIDLGCCLLIGTARTIDWEGGLLIGIVRTLELPAQLI